MTLLDDWRLWLAGKLMHRALCLLTKDEATQSLYLLDYAIEGGFMNDVFRSPK